MMLIVKQVLKIISDRRANSKLVDHKFKKNYISTVIYPSLKRYTLFERAYNNLSRKECILPSGSP